MVQLEGRALVLDSSDYRESSSLVRFFSEEEGRISLVARGAKKAKSSSPAATIQPFNLVRIRYYLKEGATIGNLAASELERVSSAPRTSIEAYALISYWFEILKETSQAREAAGKIFRITTYMLQQQEISPGLSLDFLRQISMFIQHLGFGIDWTHCVICGQATPAPAQFSISKGGVICRQCGSDEHRGLPLRPNEVTILQHLASIEAAENLEVTFTVTDMFEVLSLVNRFLTYHLEQPLKTFAFVKSSVND